MRTLLLLVTLGLSVPSLAAAQAHERVASQGYGAPAQAQERTPASRRVSRRASELAFVDTAADLRVLRSRAFQPRRARSRAPRGEGIGLMIVGGLGAGVGAAVLLVSVVSSGTVAGACGATRLALGSVDCPRSDNSGLLVASGVALGVGVVLLVVGLVVGFSGRSERGQSDRRGERPTPPRTWIGASPSPTGDGGAVSFSLSY